MLKQRTTMTMKLRPKQILNQVIPKNQLHVGAVKNPVEMTPPILIRADPNDADEDDNEDGEDIEDIEVLGELDDRKMPANEGQSEDDENEVEEVPPPPPVQPQVMLYDRKLKTRMSGVILQNMRDQMVPKVEVETARSGKKKSKSRDLKTMGLGHAVK